MLGRFSHVWLFSTLWIVARQAPLSMRILQVRILEWVVMPSSRESSQPRDRTRISCLLHWQVGSLPMYIAALFTTAKTWKQLKYPSINEWIKKMCFIYIYTHTHIHSGILLSHKIEWNDAIWSNIGGPRDYHSKWSKLDRGREISW